MKQLFFFLLLLFACTVNAQVAINNDGSTADANAMLDVKSSSKGIKFPRLTTAQRKAIPVTATDAGLFVFDTDKQKLYMYDGNAWQPLATAVTTNTVQLTNVASTLTSKNSNFGNAVAIDGNYAVVAARRDSVNGVKDVGSAVVFKCVNGVWTPQAKLLASDGESLQRFGNAVAIAGNFIAVGAEESSVAGNPFYSQGAVYLYKRTGETWAQVAKLLSPDANALANFGHQVAMEGTTLVISADGTNVGANNNQGAVYVYNYNGAAWVKTQTLLAPDGAAYDRFGSSLSLHLPWLAIGSPYDDVNAINDVGTVHIYYKSGSNFIANQQFHRAALRQSDYFGAGVAITNDTIAVAGRFKASSDQVVIYTRQVSNTWSAVRNIAAPSPDYDANSPFGYNMVWYNGDLLIASPSETVNGLDYTGTVYQYDLAAFAMEKKITDPGGFASHLFGISMAISGNRLLIGSFRNNVSFSVLDE